MPPVLVNTSARGARISLFASINATRCKTAKAYPAGLRLA